MSNIGTKTECTACGKRFSGIQAFDMHRVGSFGELIYKEDDPHTVVGQLPHTRHCASNEEMACLGMIERSNGTWARGVCKKTGSHIVPD